MILSILHILSVKASCSRNKFKENVNSAMIICSPTQFNNSSPKSRKAGIQQINAEKFFNRFETC